MIFLLCLLAFWAVVLYLAFRTPKPGIVATLGQTRYRATIADRRVWKPG